jgi:hypothetical protein
MIAALMIAAVAAFHILAGTALADHIEPAKAKARFALVNSYFRCDTPNTATQRPPGDETASCAPAVPVDSCAFSSTGSGALTVQPTGSVTQGNQDLKLSVVAQGLNAFCEFNTLCIALSYRATADDCPEGSCTTFDVQERLLAGTGCCVVTDGQCKIKTTLLTAAPSFILRGKNTGIEIHGCGLKRDGGFPNTVATCGLLLR